MRLLNIGYGNLVSAERLISIVTPGSAPVKRLVQEARDRGTLIDASCGRRTKSVLIMDSDHVVLSAVSAVSLAGRIGMDVRSLDDDTNDNEESEE
jgi:hypothetical protein